MMFLPIWLFTLLCAFAICGLSMFLGGWIMLTHTTIKVKIEKEEK